MPKKILLGAFLAILILSLLLPCALSNGLVEPPRVEWQRFFPGTVGYSVLQTDDGGYAFTALNSSASLLIKTDSLGNLVWSKAYQLGTETNLPYLIKTQDGGYALGGTLDNNYVVVKVDAQGNVGWNQSYSYEAPFNSLRSFTQTGDGGYALVGTFSPPQNASHAVGQILFLKTDASGNIQWSKVIAGPQGDFANSIFQTSDGGFVVFGTSWASETLPSSFKIIKMDAAGNEQWNRTYGGAGKFFTAESASGILTRDGGFLLAGVSVEKDSEWLAWLVKTDSEGNMVWNQNFGEVGSWALCVVSCQEGGYTFAGLHNGKDSWLVKTDANGATKWNMTFIGASTWGSSIEDFGKCLIQAKDGGYVLVGSEDSQIWLAKIAGSAQPSRGLLVEAALVAIVVAVIVILVVTFRLRHR